MQAYHNDPTIKARYVERVRSHYILDQIVQGRYWQYGKGCAVGCTIHSSEHDRYETELGIPLVLARLQDRLFEGMSSEEAKTFPLAFLEAIPVGGDLAPVLDRFLLWLLINEESGVIRFATPQGKEAIQRVADLYTKRLAGETILLDEWRLARADAAYAAAAAYDAADAAYADADAAYADADAADAAAAAYAAADAADAADADADAAAYAAADAAAAAAAAADADAADADADAAADAAAKENYYKVMKDHLLVLLAEAPVPTGVEKE
jgi:hypothetical protein